MAWTKQTLKWNTVNLAKVNGAAKASIGEAGKALSLSDEKVIAARKLLLPFSTGKPSPNARKARWCASASSLTAAAK
jgi:hypothetical protein